MLRGIHKASSTWLGRAVMAAVMGIIAISFAIWGINDIFRGFGRNVALRIGNTEISPEQLREYYNDQLRQLSLRARRPITPEQARALGFDRQLLGQLVMETTLDEQAKALRLGVSNAEVSNHIINDPNFRGLNGRFDRMRFEQVIRDAGYTEARFVDERRRILLRRQIALGISGRLKVPEAAIDAINRYQNEQRSIDYITLGPAQAGGIAAPSAETLEKYFEDHKALFRAPEYRKITLLSLSPADIAKPDQVSDADAKAYYEQHKAQYGTPEKREVRQIVYADGEDAKAARERIDKGASFDDLVKDRGLKPSDTDLGLVAKTAIIDPAIADAAFSLKPGEISQPVTGRFGTVILTVGRVEPGTQKSFEDVRDKIEDERAGGATLIESGRKFGLKTRVIDAIDRAGNGPDGKPVADLPEATRLVAAVFASDVGVDNEALQLPNGGYLYYDVTAVTPSHERRFEEVKAQVEQRWRDDETSKRLAAKADDLLAKLKAGASIADVAAGAGLAVETANGLLRGKPTDKLPARLVAAVFNTAKDSAGIAEGDRQTERYVFRVTGVAEAKLDPASPQAKAIASSLQSSYGDDITTEYIAWLEEQFGVDVNQAAINQVFGGGNQSQ
jgi:peptidyl-prolyl cis-trans isomerase D